MAATRTANAHWEGSLFEGKGRVERQRLIYSVLSELMASDIHALSIQALTPAEAGNG